MLKVPGFADTYLQLPYKTHSLLELLTTQGRMWHPPKVPTKASDYEPCCIARVFPDRRAYLYIQYAIGEELGEGAFGKAYRAVRHRVGTGTFSHNRRTGHACFWVMPATARRRPHEMTSACVQPLFSHTLARMQVSLCLPFYHCRTGSRW